MHKLSLVGHLRWVAIAEGVSYLLLLLVGMPLKYLVQLPEPNYVIGLAHGILFIAYIGLVVGVAWKHKWTLWNTFLALAASLLPLATFWVERKMLRKEDYSSQKKRNF